MDLKLPEAGSLDAGQIQLVLATNELMKSYEQDRLVRQLDTAEITTEYLERFIDLLENAQEWMPSETSQTALVDALVVVRCFAAFPLLQDNRPGPKHVPDVLDFVQTADIGWSDREVAPILAHPQPWKSDLFWRYVRTSIVTGRLKVAHAALDKVLDHLPGDLSSIFDTLQVLLETYPMSVDSEYIWRQWRKNAMNLLSQVQTAIEPGAWRQRIEPIVLILRGQVDAIVSDAPSWYSALGGLYAFTDPSPDMLPLHFRSATAHHSVDTTLDWEEACAAVFEERLLSSIVTLQRLDLSSAVVLVEFCYQRGLLQVYPNNEAAKIREEIALRLARACLAEPELMSTGVEILSNMANHRAKQAATELLPQLVSRLPDSIGLAIHLAEQLDLPELASTVSRVAAERDLRDNSYVQAATSYFQAGDLAACRSTAWLLFEKMLLLRQPVGDEQSLEALRSQPDASGLPMVVRDCLAPVAVLLSIFDKLGPDAQEPVALVANDINSELSALLSFPNPPLQFYPLLVALILDLGSQSLSTKTNVLLMVALDQWQDTAPKDVRQESESLLNQAVALDQWQPLLDPSYSLDEIVWMLRRRLAFDVY